MKYIGEFKDVNGLLYQLEIITAGEAGQTENIVLGGNPIITTVEGDDENIFKPVKYSSATVELVVKEFMPDIYSSFAQGTKIILKQNNQIKWTGYVAPNCYDQDYNYMVEKLEIECIDGLSTLLYINFPSKDKKSNFFMDIICKILKLCNCYKYVYFPASLQEEAYVKNNYTGRENIFNCLSVCESNFFDEDGKAMKCDEVLEEICKFAGVTCIAEGDSVYLINYDALLADPNLKLNIVGQYYSVDLINDIYKIIPELIEDVKSLHITEAKTKISLGKTFNNIKVVDSLYSEDDIIPDINDNSKITNRRMHPHILPETIYGYEYKEIEFNFPELHINDKMTYDAFYQYLDHVDFKSQYYRWKEVDKEGKPLEHPYFEEIYNDPLNHNLPAWYYQYVGNIVGGTIMKVSANKRETDYDPNIQLPHLDWSTYIYIANNGYEKKEIWDETLKKYVKPILPCMSLKLDKSLCLNSKNSYITLDCEINFCSRGVMLPVTGKKFGGDDFDDVNLYIEMQIRYGDKWYVGNSNDGEWDDFPGIFNLYLDPLDTDNLYNNPMRPKTNIDYHWGLETNRGFAIKLPENYISTEPPEIIFLKPMHHITNRDIDDGKLDYTGYWIGDLHLNVEVVSQIGANIIGQELDSDTKYENAINENYVNDFNEIEFKVCTWDEKNANYSTVIYDNGKVRKYVDKLFDTRNTDRSEELYIKRIAKLYSLPPIILDTVTDNNLHCYSLLYNDTLFSDKVNFIMDSCEINWRYNTNNVKLNQIKL